MNRLPILTTLISFLLAVALWALATWLEDDLAAIDAAPDVTADFNGETGRSDSPVRAASPDAGCIEVEAALRQQVSDSQHCTTDDDCTLFDYGYPMQCLMSVAKTEIPALRYAYRDYAQSCPYRVYYDCPTGDMEREAVCRSNRCTVELQSTGILEEETLEYLGIDPRR